MTASVFKPVRVLSIAGSDSGGGAGVQADIKTISALGGYAMSAITAITAQNTVGVAAVHQVPPAVVRAQIQAVIEDIGVDAIKIGMLGDAITAAAIANALGETSAPIVLDPVMVASSGAALADADTKTVIRTKLVPLCRLLTPNIPEAEALTGIKITGIDSQRAAAEALLAMGAPAVLVKGGHGVGETITDFLLWNKGEALFESARIHTRHTHGTGCTLASAIAVFLAQKMSLIEAVRAARIYVRGAIKNAPEFGAGHGPMNHFWNNRKEN